MCFSRPKEQKKIFFFLCCLCQERTIFCWPSLFFQYNPRILLVAAREREKSNENTRMNPCIANATDTDNAIEMAYFMA